MAQAGSLEQRYASQRRGPPPHLWIKANERIVTRLGQDSLRFPETGNGGLPGRTSRTPSLSTIDPQTICISTTSTRSDSDYQPVNDFLRRSGGRRYPSLGHRSRVPRGNSPSTGRASKEIPSFHRRVHFRSGGSAGLVYFQQCPYLYLTHWDGYVTEPGLICLVSEIP